MVVRKCWCPVNNDIDGRVAGLLPGKTNEETDGFDHGAKRLQQWHIMVSIAVRFMWPFVQFVNRITPIF